jgi:hypothetical protein
VVERRASLPLGVVVERRKSTSRWQAWVWRPVAVIPGAPTVEPGGRELMRGEGWTRYLAGTLPLELHRSETEAYKANLAGRTPAIHVVLRRRPGAEEAYDPFLVTASPYEALCYEVPGDAIVEPVPMPEGLIAWIQDFVDRHHVERPFYKRKRDRGGRDRPGGGSPVGKGERDGGARR